MRMLDAVLSAVFLLSVQTLVFGLIPLHMMDGRRLLAWSRRAWLAVYAVAVICFVHLLVLNRRDVLGQGTAPAFVSTLALFIGFGALSLAFWAYFRYRPPRPVLADPPTPPVPPTPRHRRTRPPSPGVSRRNVAYTATERTEHSRRNSRWQTAVRGHRHRALKDVVACWSSWLW